MFLNSIIGSFRQTSGNSPEPVRKKSPPTVGNDALILALRKADRALSISELANVMGCSVGESSKRVTAAKKFVKVQKCGRRKLVSLKDLDRSQVLSLMKTMSPGAYWLT